MLLEIVRTMHSVRVGIEYNCFRTQECGHRLLYKKTMVCNFAIGIIIARIEFL